MLKRVSVIVVGIHHIISISEGEFNTIVGKKYCVQRRRYSLSVLSCRANILFVQTKLNARNDEMLNTSGKKRP
jgi:hypothetical protein